MLEWVWFLNSHPEAIYGTMYGDKDTFPLSFYLAGKGEIYNQIPVPPGAILDATPEDVRPFSKAHRHCLFLPSSAGFLGFANCLHHVFL